MLIASGTVLVLVTWTACTAALVSLGLLPALVTAPAPAGGRRVNAAPALRRAIWWGALVVTVFAYLVNLAQPLHSGTTTAVALGLLAVLGIPGWWLLARRGLRMPRARHNWPFVLLWVALAVSLVYLAAAALGPVTNYDSGLYHLGAIKYAADFPTVPGLANLFFALGYGNAEFPLAALLGNGPWQGEGYRLLNGLFMGLAVVDLGLRAHQRRLSPSFFVLAVGILAAWVPMVALSDYWVTSPTQDSSVFVLTVVATAYLADAAHGGRRWLAEAATAVVLGVLLVVFRPTMAAFAGTALLVVGILLWRRRATTPAIGRVVGLVAAAAILAGLAATLRDIVLSGWLQFPLSIHAFDVPWRAADPTGNRAATLGYHRNPADLWNSVEGWSWVGPWLADRVRQWETYEFVGLVVAAAVLAHLADRATRPHARWRAMLVAVAPSAVATAFWWLATPPSYRFAWGPLFTLATVPIGWSLWLLVEQHRRSRVTQRAWLAITGLGIAMPILLVTTYSALARFHMEQITAAREWHLGVSVPYAVAPVVDVPVKTVTTSSRLELLQPTRSDQCWDHYPLCTPWPTPSLHLRGEDIGSGFLP